ncbi:MAG: zinc metalloprotease HtpX [Candidatus Moraniibacteriota bacterium]|nr:MAG: zinc metalloprotease HtpX [Candidatus Moranbacteria bacterium]
MGATLYTHQTENIVKTWLLITAFLGLLIAVGFVFSMYFNNGAFLVVSSVFAVGTSMWSYWFSDKMVLKMTGAKEVSRENLKELYEIVDNLAITAGLPTPKIYVIDDMALNAFATGRNPQHGVIVFTRGLLERLDKEEIRGVAAHEMSHIGNRDILIGTVAVIFTSIIAMTSRIMFFSGGDSRDRGGVFFLITGLILLVLSPIIATLLRLAISRKREFLADASGAMLTRYPEGLASALEKISSDARPVQTASDTTAHLFIANPFKDTKRISKLFATHPPVEERIARLRGSLDV